MMHKALETQITQLITAPLAGAGYELVRVQVTSGGRYLTLQIMAERLDAKPMTINDCTEINHAVSAVLEADPQLVDTYTLEVSSPGVDRPLMKLKDYQRFTGHVARVELEMPLDAAGGQKRFQGSIKRITRTEPDAEIEFQTDAGDVRVPMSTIARAKLVMTDALLNVKSDTKH
jgi:ribosome maturation factor RimP